MLPRLAAILFLAGAGALHAASTKALILYDSKGTSSWVGSLHGKMLGNLLGHFQLGYKLETVEQYRAGEIANHRAVFYLGTVFNNPLPHYFITDVFTRA